MHSIASMRLREMLHWWKYLCLAREVQSTPAMYPHVENVSKYLKLWRQYEKVVLDNSISHLYPHEWFEQRDALPEEQLNFVHHRLKAAESFPCELFEWNRTSRRAFHIPENLQCIFMAGSYATWKWEDLLWPYESIVLTLDRPLEVEDDTGIWSRYDTIMATHVVHPGRGKVLVMRMLKSPFGPRPDIFPVRESNLADRFLATGDRHRAWKAVSKLEDHLITDMEIPQGNHCAPLYATFDRKRYAQPRDFIQIESEDIARRIPTGKYATFDEKQWKAAVHSMACKIIVGWCAYMNQLRTNAYEKIRVPSERGTRGITGIITTPEHICTMLLKSRIEPGRYVETKEREYPSGMFKRPHWRRGHWKREPGAGPNAEPTIRVPPMLIRWDLVPIFGIISGTETYIEDE